MVGIGRHGESSICISVNLYIIASYRPFGMEEIHENDYKSSVSRTDSVSVDPLKREIGGDHYKSSYQPIQLMEKVRMYACCSYIFKYVFRHKNKGKKQDLEKALHCCQLMDVLGNNWYQGTSHSIDCIDTSFEEFYRFIKGNKELDKNQIRAILGIAHKDMGMLTGAIRDEIKEYY